MTASELERAMAWHLKVAELPKPESEFIFAPPRRWRFDFAWPTAKVALEVEGGTFLSGRHSRGRGFEDDCIKYDEAAIAGWLVIRVTGDMVTDGRALALVERALAARPGSAR